MNGETGPNPLWDDVAHVQAAERRRLAAFLSASTWATREIPTTRRLLGDWVINDSRGFVVGYTGTGKTMLAIAMGLGMATGDGFLHWRCDRPARVLYIDGEMTPGLVKTRIKAEMRRANPVPAGGALMLYARGLDEETAAAFPGLGIMPPLNSEPGRAFVLKLIQMVGGVDVVIFDNLMSLLSGGDMKEEQGWADTLPLVTALSAKRIAQIWFDHTGHKRDQQYGTSTKAWRMDFLGIMKSLPGKDLAFQLSFEASAGGKARRRTPDNWADFAPTTIRLIDDRWTTDKPPTKPAVAPSALALHGALLAALEATTTPGQTTREAWHAEAVQRGLLEAYGDDDSPAAKDAKRARLRKAIKALLAAGWIAEDGEVIRNLHAAEP